MTVDGEEISCDQNAVFGWYPKDRTELTEQSLDLKFKEHYALNGDRKKSLDAIVRKHVENSSCFVYFIDIYNRELLSSWYKSGCVKGNVSMDVDLFGELNSEIVW